MSDIRTLFKSYNGDYEIKNTGLSQDHTLETQVILSLFTDQRASDDDELPDSRHGRRGWWRTSRAKRGRTQGRV